MATEERIARPRGKATADTDGRTRQTPGPAVLRTIHAATEADFSTDALARAQSQLIGLIADALDHHEFHQSALSMASEFASLFRCQRVSIGTYRGKRMEVDVLSNTSQFEARSSLARRLARTMEEACDQGDTVLYPEPPDATNVTLAHQDLAQVNEVTAICTIPLVDSQECVGAILMERSDGEAFTAREVALAEHACLLLTPILQLKRRAEDPLLKRWRESMAASASQVLGPKHMVAKLTTIVCACILAILSTTETQYQVTSSASLEPEDVRTVASPTRGFIAQIEVKAGDYVTEGTPLAELDQRDLQLELEKYRNELARKSKEAQAALATRDRTRMRVLASQEKQIQAQVRLVETLIQRGHLTSPVEGVVITANPGHSFGSPVERGEVLFEIAPLTDFNLIMEVDEKNIAEIHEGNTGKLVLTARPQESLPFSITRIVPVSSSSDGATTFRVEADLSDQPDWIRPGMSGISKVALGDRKLLWVWTHHVVEAIQMRWWRWGWL